VVTWRHTFKAGRCTPISKTIFWSCSMTSHVRCAPSPTRKRANTGRRGLSASSWRGWSANQACPRTIAAIAEVAPITVARLVDRLEVQGLVERCTDPKDRRIWRLRLTRAAAPVLRDLTRYRAEVRALMTKGVDPAVLKAMVVGLRRMKENLSSSLAEAAE
jgi:DNA-binding MarR family transcriptional regulator